MKNYLSFGGGVNSVALYLLMEDLGMKFEAVFVDHGGDLPETYEYTKYFIDTGHPITIIHPDVKGESNIYEYYFNKKRTPSIKSRECTGQFKRNPFNKYVEKPCFIMLGIDAGESRRARLSSINGIENRYPLIEENIDREGCKKLITNHGLEVPPKSGCFFCPFQRKSQWVALRRKHPDLFTAAQKLEDNMIENHKLLNKKYYTLYSNGKRISEIVKQRKGLLPQFYQEYPPCQCEDE